MEGSWPETDSARKMLSVKKNPGSGLSFKFFCRSKSIRLGSIPDVDNPLRFRLCSCFPGYRDHSGTESQKDSTIRLDFRPHVQSPLLYGWTVMELCIPPLEEKTERPSKGPDQPKTKEETVDRRKGQKSTIAYAEQGALGETSGTKEAPEEENDARVPEHLLFLVEGTRELCLTPAHTKEAGDEPVKKKGKKSDRLFSAPRKRRRLFQNVHIAEEDKLPPLSRRLGFRPTTECRFSCVMHSKGSGLLCHQGRLLGHKAVKDYERTREGDLGNDDACERSQELPEAMGGPEATVRKILLAGLWSPTMTTNVKGFCADAMESMRGGNPLLAQAPALVQVPAAEIQAVGPVDPEQIGVDLVAFAVDSNPDVDPTQLTGDSRSTRRNTSRGRSEQAGTGGRNGIRSGPGAMDPLDGESPMLHSLGSDWCIAFHTLLGLLGRRILLHFQAVDSAFYAWINGVPVGYSQDSRLPAEFEITDSCHPCGSEKKNVLAVQVFRWSDGSYLEDQDHWWLSGIHRDVLLLAKPKVFIADYFFRSDLGNNFSYADLQLLCERATSSSGKRLGLPTMRLEVKIDNSREISKENILANFTLEAALYDNGNGYDAAAVVDLLSTKVAHLKPCTSSDASLGFHGYLLAGKLQMPKLWSAEHSECRTLRTHRDSSPSVDSDDKDKLHCDYYQRPRHTRETYWRLHGRLQDEVVVQALQVVVVAILVLIILQWSSLLL
ncbi:glycoside hydrolase family 2 protein [Actinidia rufa]|uniref:beta-galactosidase n=1 Tax=Actinidia rufa TaxID=165716 RepID=A0A7J0F8B7_9ERIC|nr:glycoside hydrolase family 2 protein [Actinidia rufa]